MNAQTDFSFTVPLGAVAPADLTDASVNFAPNPSYTAAILDEDATCTGTFNAPTAPAGKVCLYLDYVDNPVNDSVLGTEVNSPGAQRRTFAVTWTDRNTDNSVDAFLAASWAYTAP